jgi:hypothetical protein
MLNQQSIESIWKNGKNHPFITSYSNQIDLDNKKSLDKQLLYVNFNLEEKLELLTKLQGSNKITDIQSETIKRVEESIAILKIRKNALLSSLNDVQWKLNN